MRKLLLALGVVLVVAGLALQFFQPADRAAEPTPVADERSLRDTTAGPVICAAGPQETFQWLGVP